MIPEDPSVTDSSDQPVAVAPITQILTGHALTDASTVPCHGCSDPLSVGDIVFATASRDTGQCRWTVDRVSCWGCVRTTIGPPNVGRAEALVGGRLGLRSDPTMRLDQLCLTELELRD